MVNPRLVIGHDIDTLIKIIKYINYKKEIVHATIKR